MMPSELAAAPILAGVAAVLLAVARLVRTFHQGHVARIEARHALERARLGRQRPSRSEEPNDIDVTPERTSAPTAAARAPLPSFPGDEWDYVRKAELDSLRNELFSRLDSILAIAKRLDARQTTLERRHGGET
jgi:hypothetical protein